MKIDFEKQNGLVPAVIQDCHTGRVLMLGYMNEEAFEKTRDTGKVSFFSRSRNELWTKGETSGNELLLREMKADCDNDTILIKVEPTGPVWHTGADTCFNEKNPREGIFFLEELEHIIETRKKANPEESYTAKLFGRGVGKIAQKVGEEATEVVIDAVMGDDKALKEECADLIYHLLLLLNKRDLRLSHIADVLEKRHRK